MSAENTEYKVIILASMIRLLVITLFCCIGTLRAQDRMEIVNRAKEDLKQAKSDSARIFFLNKISWNISYSDLDSGLYYGNLALELAQSTNDRSQLGIVYTTLATIHQDKGNLSIAAELYEKSIKAHEAINDKSGLATTLSNYSNLEGLRGNRKKAKELLFTALGYFKLENNKRSIALVTSNLGTHYLEENKLDSAEYFLEIGNSYCKEYAITDLLSSNTAVLARVHSKQGKKKQAIEEIEFALELLSIRKSPYDLVQVEQIYADMLTDYQDYYQAEKYYLSAREKAEMVGMKDHIMKINLSLSGLYEKMGLLHKSLAEYKNYAALKDELNEASALEKLNHMSYRMENERKSKEIELLRQKSRIQDLDQDRQHEQIRTQNIIIIGGALLFLLVIVMSIHLFRSNKRKQQTNALLTEQNHIIEHKNKEITDSITYARRIQDAILPSKDVLNTIFPEHFILYLPKDIVAGDFYWVLEHKGKIFFAVCDCTGHGVPGAMVSVVCHNALQSVVREMNITDPGEILNHVRTLVTETFQSKQSEVRDGMDVSLGVLDKSKAVLTWAGANNPLWIVRSNTAAIQEIKAHKQAIGKTDDPTPFPSHTIQLEKGDLIYLFSDGFADQFGGKDGKKFKSSGLKELLRSVAVNPIALQHQLLHEAHLQWKGDYEQVDDICFFGVRV